MGATQLREGRKAAGLTQAEAASRLGVSQAYLSLLEGGKRSASGTLVRRAVSLYRLPVTTLPVRQDLDRVPSVQAQELAEELAALGYPGFAYMRSRKKRNPAEVLLTALGQQDLESRVVEALPWVVLQYPDLDWDWLLKFAKQNELQNRLGFVTTLARRLAESNDMEHWKVAALSGHESDLDWARLAREDTLCKQSLTTSERSWLKERRSQDAVHWNLLTDLAPEHLSHAVAAR